MWGVDLRARDRQAELMDCPELDRRSHMDALAALGRINTVSLSARRVSDEVARLHSRTSRGVRVLDLACGGGDVLTRVGARARRRGVDVTLHGCDLSQVALDVARDAVGGDRRFEFFRLNALTDEIPSGYDLICSSLFLHHLSDLEAASLLSRMAEATGDTLLVQDLRRTSLGYVFAYVGLHALTRSEVARGDGLKSVRAAFTSEEASRLCAAAGLAEAETRTCWPQRLTIRWRRP